jgi:hypothetical protein
MPAVLRADREEEHGARDGDGRPARDRGARAGRDGSHGGEVAEVHGRAGVHEPRGGEERGHPDRDGEDDVDPAARRGDVQAECDDVDREQQGECEDDGPDDQRQPRPARPLLRGVVPLDAVRTVVGEGEPEARGDHGREEDRQDRERPRHAVAARGQERAAVAAVPEEQVGPRVGGCPDDERDEPGEEHDVREEAGVGHLVEHQLRLGEPYARRGGQLEGARVRAGRDGEGGQDQCGDARDPVDGAHASRPLYGIRRTVTTATSITAAARTRVGEAATRSDDAVSAKGRAE